MHTYKTVKEQRLIKILHPYKRTPLILAYNKILLLEQQIFGFAYLQDFDSI